MPKTSEVSQNTKPYA